MSVQATSWVREQKINPPTDKFVLYVLADYCNSFGLAYPSVTRLADDTGYDRKTVFEALRRLKEQKLIEDSGKRVGHTKQVVVYRLPWADIDPEKGGPGGTVPKAEQFRSDAKQSQSALENHQKEPSVPKGGGNGKDADRIAAIFNRRKKTPWSAKEIKAFKLLLPFDDDELIMVERYYKANRDRDGNWCRRDVLTFLNNFRGEVDRAYAWCKRHPLKSQRTTRPPAPKPPELTDEQVAEQKQRVHGMVEELRNKLRMPNGS